MSGQVVQEYAARKWGESLTVDHTVAPAGFQNKSLLVPDPPLVAWRIIMEEQEPLC